MPPIRHAALAEKIARRIKDDGALGKCKLGKNHLSTRKTNQKLKKKNTRNVAGKLCKTKGLFFAAATPSLAPLPDFFVSPLADEPAGSTKAKLFPFGWFLRVIPSFWACICQRYTQLGTVQMAADLPPSHLAPAQPGYLMALTMPGTARAT